MESPLQRLKRPVAIGQLVFFAFTAVIVVSCTKVGGGRQEAAVEASRRTSLSGLAPEARKKFYVWLTKEMLEQIYGEPPRGAEPVARWVNILEQGANIQGVYHGMILSREYAVREKPKATAGAARFFAEELAILRSGKSDWDDALSGVAAEIQGRVRGASIFLLKRELGRAVLDRVSALSRDSGAVARFYADSAVRLSRRGINFGLSQRNSAEFEFHNRWALSNERGLIEWELLNRYHRCLNRFGGLIPAGR